MFMKKLQFSVNINERLKRLNMQLSIRLSMILNLQLKEVNSLINQMTKLKPEIFKNK
jgi:hypothetical protein